MYKQFFMGKKCYLKQKHCRMGKSEEQGSGQGEWLSTWMGDS